MHLQVSLTIELSATSTVTSLEEEILNQGRESMRQALRAAIKQWEQHQRRCPVCGEHNVRVEGTVGRTVLLLFGRVRLGLRRFRCQSCRHRWCPARRLLRDLHQQQVSAALREAAVLAGASWPYRHAAHLLERVSGAQISAEELRLLTMQEGQRRAKQQQQHAKEVLAQPASGQPGQPGIVGMDGGWVPSREQRGGMEGKVGVIALEKQALLQQPQPDLASLSWYEIAKRHRQGKRLSPAQKRHRWTKRRYVATFAPSKHFGGLVGAGVREMGLDASKSVVVADGADWIKQESRAHVAGATCILDWPHLWRVVRKAVGQVQREQQRSDSWRRQQSAALKAWLWHGHVQQAQEQLQRWKEEGAEASRALQTAITYLEHQQEWIGSYADWREQGLPVGSGIIERAVALVINRRMKRRGMRWKRTNATSLVALRTDFLNDDWVREPLARVFP